MIGPIELDEPRRLPDSVDVDGHELPNGMFLIGRATRQPNGKWIALAVAGCALLKVEVSITAPILKRSSLVRSSSTDLARQIPGLHS